MWRGDPTNPVPVHIEIVPIHKNHANAGTVHTTKNHVDARTVLILENRIDVETVHICASMLIRVQIPQWSDGPTTLLWML